MTSTAERTVQTERRVSPSQSISHDEGPLDLVETSDDDRRAQLTSRSGVKRPTPETPGSRGPVY